MENIRKEVNFGNNLKVIIEYSVKEHLCYFTAYKDGKVFIINGNFNKLSESLIIFGYDNSVIDEIKEIAEDLKEDSITTLKNSSETLKKAKKEITNILNKYNLSIHASYPEEINDDWLTIDIYDNDTWEYIELNEQ